MATHENTNPNPGLLKDIMTRDIFTCFPRDPTISYVLSRLPVKTLLILRSVSKSCMSLISSSYLIEHHLFKSYNDDDVLSCLPKVIIYNILLRLPVKILLRLNSVSKSWLSLISSPEFVKTHHSKSNNDPEFTHHHLITYFVTCEYTMRKFRSLSLYSLLNEPNGATTEFIKHEYIETKFMNVVGCCNGVICLSTSNHYEDLILWNPSTRESRTLPRLDLPYYTTYDDRYEPQFSSCGFCYDESNDDYKVFHIFLKDSYACLSVYSSKTGCRRLIRELPYHDSLGVGGKGKFANGAIHWVNGDNTRIVSLDIRTETFQEVLQPRFGDVDCWTLGTFGKNLSVCAFGNTHFDFWVMKKDSSWSKLFTIPCTVALKEYSNFKLIDICVNGDIIMMSKKHLQLYNSKDKMFKNLVDTRGGFYKSGDYEHRMVYMYAESLVSPFF